MAIIWVNRACEIMKVDESWDKLAENNQAFELYGDAIKGKLFWNFIQGDVTKMFLDALITRVNITEKPFILHYRCDSPSQAKLIRMMISKEEHLFKIEHDLVNSEEISPAIGFTEDLQAENKRCMLCGKVQFKNSWYDALTSRKVFGALTELKTRSVICEGCRKTVPFFKDD